MIWRIARRWLSPALVAGSFLAAERSGDPTIIPSQESCDFGDIVEDVKDLISQKMTLANIPGACCVVHVNGNPVMKAGFGYSDIENCIPFTCKTSMRIASISKFITAIMTMNMVDKGELDLNENLADMLKSQDIELTLDGEAVESLTLCQLLNHTSGVRHYHDSDESAGDTAALEFYSNKHYPTVKDGLQMFINDSLLFKPGSDFKYTTFGYSLLSFVLEHYSGKTFPELVKTFADFFGLDNTRCDSFEDIILNRAHYYCRTDGLLKNCPYVDNSCKWAGGGLVSTAEDIAKLGDQFFFLQNDGLANSDSRFTEMVAHNPVTEKCTDSGLSSHYGYGVKVFHKIDRLGKIRQRYKVSHTGGAVGASSVLLVLPLGLSKALQKPEWVTVVMFNNSCDGDVIKLAHEIADKFADRLAAEDECLDKMLKRC